MIVSEDFLEKHGLTPRAEILSYADAAHDPDWFTTAPTIATPLALHRAGLGIADVDLYEVNEAFSVVPMVFAQQLNVDYENLNVHGGAVSLGHPLGASGSRIVTTLINALDSRDQSIGCASICNGGGGASSIVIRRMR